MLTIRPAVATDAPLLAQLLSHLSDRLRRIAQSSKVPNESRFNQVQERQHRTTADHRKLAPNDRRSIAVRIALNPRTNFGLVSGDKAGGHGDGVKSRL